VGHYCHDQLTLQSGEVVHSLGGSVSYITNVFKALGMECKVASKVGPDFLYPEQITHSPAIVEDQQTTEFFADFTQGDERVLKAGNICEPIVPRDIDDMEYELGLAVGIACEVLPETLKQMVDVSRYVVVDVQALIRTIDPETGLVGLRNLEETPFYDMLEDISFLKAARNEAVYIDIEKVRSKTCVIVTEGKNGSRIYSVDREFRVPAFPATEVDPTGAGDSFLAGFSAGLYQGLPVEQAVLMGNYFGGMAVGQVGIPHFTAKQLECMEETRGGVLIEQIPFEHK
jgi:1D-myo-inositol 3-kinase